MKLNVVKKVIAACLLSCCATGVLPTTYAMHNGTESTSSHHADMRIIETPRLILRPFGFRWCITFKGNDEPIGEIEVVTVIDKHTCEVGYAFSKPNCNKDIVIEAMRCIRWYLLAEARFTKGTEFTKIIAKHHIDNPDSEEILEKSGFERVGVDGIIYQTTPSYQEMINIEF